MKKSSNQKLALKILNELKYNKRMIYLWRKLVVQQSTEENIYKFLVNKLKAISFNIENISTNSECLPLFKTVEKDLVNNQSSDEKKYSIVSFDKEKEVELSKIEYNHFIIVELDMFLLSVIWVDRVGRLLDKELSEEIFANRTVEHQNTFFELYFTAYNNYRDEAFKQMNHLIDESQEGVTIQLDLKRCFYNIDVKYLENEVNVFLDEQTQKEDRVIYKNLNRKIFECIYKYNEHMSNNLDNVACRLPIGFLPSGILANFYLKVLDEALINELNPMSYGRYVDDITIVLKRRISSENVEDEIFKLNERIENIKNEVFKKRKVKIDFNLDKKVYFIIRKTSDRNYIKKFKKNTEELSSDFYRLIDVNELDIEIDAAYEIVDRPTKLNELFEIQKDKKAITKTIAAVFYTLYAEPIKNKETNKLLAKTLMKKFDEFIDKEMFLEIFDYWLPLILIEYVSLEKKYEETKLTEEDFKKLKVIKRLDEIKEISKLKKINDMTAFIDHYYYLFEALFKEKTFVIGSRQYLKDLLNNFTLPKFLNPMFEDFYLTFEQQLLDLHKLIELNHEGPTKTESDFIRDFNGLAYKGVLDSKNTKGSMNLENEKYLDLDFLETNKLKPIKLSQVNIYDPKQRNEQFIQFSTNTEKSSETIKSLNLAVKQHSDVLLFPEHGLNITDLSKLVKFVKRTEIPIIGGVDYILLNESVLNLTIAILPFPSHKSKEEFYADCAILLYPKRYPAPEEYEIFTNSSCRTNPTIKRNIYIPEDKETGLNFKFKGIVHSILNCYEATDLKIKADLVGKSPDFIHMVTNNKDIDYYGSIGKTISRELMTTSTITNYSKYGGTQIFIPFKEKYKQLVSQHKGSEALHVFTSSIDVEGLRNKRSNNTNTNYRQNPPGIYYKNAKGRKE